jgi:hypothetical protein
VIQYDTLQSGKHAYDYLTSFDATETDADPVHDISGTTAGNCFTIPVDLTNMFANPGSTQEPGCIQIYNGTITSVVYGLDAPDSGQRTVIVNFTATDPTVVIAWGGHIASQIDWGVGNSASAISGSPYHMRLLTLDDTQLGNQDRSRRPDHVRAGDRYGYGNPFRRERSGYWQRQVFRLRPSRLQPGLHLRWNAGRGGGNDRRGPGHIGALHAAGDRSLLLPWRVHA